MKRIALIIAAVMLVFGLSCGCSKKKQAPATQQAEISAIDANSADPNNLKLDEAVK